MWQFLFVAALAGSTGFLANHLRAGDTNRKRIHKCDLKRRQKPPPGSDQAEARDKELESSGDSPETQVSSPSALQSPIDGSVRNEEGIFRFSSPEPGSGNGSRIGARNLRKKGGNRKSGLIGGGGGARSGVEQKKGSRRFSVCLKRRRTGKNPAPDKRGSSSSEGVNSFFSWGLGVGMMYMMSAGKSEIGKLNASMDETAKAIEELKAELKRRKSSSGIPVEHSAGEVKPNTKKFSSEHIPLKSNELGTENREPNDTKLSSLPAVDDVECPSSVVTEEPEPELLEMDQLEAEFVSELQKLPWSIAETSCPDVIGQNLPEFDAVNDSENEMEHHISDPYQFHGVKPSELDKKLSHLLIEQQENQIIELESELQTAQLKLNEKEAELQALKDCVRHLTELSLSTITDDETEAREGVGCTDILDYNNMVGSESKRSVVGMKRSIDSDLCGY